MGAEKKYLDAESFVEYWKEKEWLYEHYPVPVDEVVADAVRERGVPFTNSQADLLRRCLKLYYKACKLINEGNDWSDTNGEQEDLLELANTLEKIFGRGFDIYYDQ